MKFWTKECNSIVVCWIIWKVIDKASGIYYISSTISSWHVLVSIWEELDVNFQSTIYRKETFHTNEMILYWSKLFCHYQKWISCAPIHTLAVPLNQATIFETKKKKKKKKKKIRFLWNFTIIDFYSAKQKSTRIQRIQCKNVFLRGTTTIVRHHVSHSNIVSRTVFNVSVWFWTVQCFRLVRMIKL